jgi:PKD repeat protein
VITALLAADLDGNGKAEIIAGATDGKIYCMDHGGNQLWTYTASGVVHGTPALVDLHGTGKLSIILGTEANEIVAIDSSGTFKWSRTTTGAIKGSPAASTSAPGTNSGRFIFVATADSKIVQLDAQGNGIETPVGSGQLTSPAVGITGEGQELDIGLGTSDGDLVLGKVLDQQWSTNWSVDLGGVVAPPVMVDLDSDGHSDLVAGDGSGRVSAYKGDGGLCWSFTTGGGGPVSPVAATLALGPVVVFGDSSGYVHALYANGSRLWKIGAVDAIAAPPIIVDVDGDSDAEIVAGIEGGYLQAWNTFEVLEAAWNRDRHDLANTGNLDVGSPGLERSSGWSIDRGTLGVAPHVIADVTANKDLEVVYVEYDEIGDAYKLVLLNGDGKTLDSLDAGVVTGPVLAADISGGSAKEIVLANLTHVVALDGNLAEIWSYPLISAEPIELAESLPVIAAGNIDGDSEPEVVVSNQTGRVLALRGATGEEIWAMDTGHNTTAIATGDLDGDGYFEILVSTDNGMLFCVNETGVTEWISPMLLGSLSAPLLADLDSDSRPDVVAGTGGGDLIALDEDGSTIWKTNLAGNLSSPVLMLNDAGEKRIVVGSDLGYLHVLDTGGNLVSNVTVDDPGEISVFEAGGDRATRAFVGTGTGYAVIDPESGFKRDWGGGILGSAALFGDLCVEQQNGMCPDGEIEVVYSSYDVPANSYFLDSTSTGHADAGASLWSTVRHDQARTGNPFATSDGRFLPDLSIAPSGITLDPFVLYNETSISISVEVQNLGPVASPPSWVQLAMNGTPQFSLGIPAIGAFGSTIVEFHVGVTLDDHSFRFRADHNNTLEELDEENNVATRGIALNLPPVAVAGPDTRANPGEDFIFDGSGSTDPDGKIVDYHWFFGDGFSAHGRMVTYNYSKSGRYNVTLKVTDMLGGSSCDNMWVSINHAPSINEFYPETTQPTINEGEKAGFHVTATDLDGDYLSVTWYFDGEPVETGQGFEFWANFSSAGYHEIFVEVTDGNLSDSQSWNLSITESQRIIQDYTPEHDTGISEGGTQIYTIQILTGYETASVHWYLDGVPSGRDPETFMVMAGKGSAGIHSVRVEVVRFDVYDFHDWVLTVDKKEDETGIRWYFPENDTVDVVAGESKWFSIGTDGFPLQWHVDGTAQLGATGPSFEYRAPASDSGAVITVTVGTGDNLVSRQWTVRITHPPVALINASAMVVKTGSTVEFSGERSYDTDPGDNIVEMRWDFGDGSSVITGDTVNHKFTKAGAYTVQLTVVDSDGLEGFVEIVIVVKAKPEESPGFGAWTALLAVGMGLIFTFRRRGRDDD